MRSSTSLSGASRPSSRLRNASSSCSRPTTRTTAFRSWQRTRGEGISAVVGPVEPAWSSRSSSPVASRRRIRAVFDAGPISSDGGALLLRQVDRKIGLLAAMARCSPTVVIPLAAVAVLERIVRKVRAPVAGCHDHHPRRQRLRGTGAVRRLMLRSWRIHVRGSLEAGSGSAPSQMGHGCSATWVAGQLRRARQAAASPALWLTHRRCLSSDRGAGTSPKQVPDRAGSNLQPTL